MNKEEAKKAAEDLLLKKGMSDIKTHCCFMENDSRYCVYFEAGHGDLKYQYFNFKPDRVPPPKGKPVWVRFRESEQWLLRESEGVLSASGFLLCLDASKNSIGVYWDFWKPIEKSYDSEERETHLKAIEGLIRMVGKFCMSTESVCEKCQGIRGVGGNCKGGCRAELIKHFNLKMEG